MPFERVTTPAGISYTGQTWSAAWGDSDGDGRLDLWISKHNPHKFNRDTESATLYRNNADGSFTNVSSERVEFIRRDFHGSSWADYDNDGDTDIISVHSSERGEPATLYQNNPPSAGGLSLTDVSVAAGLGIPAGGFTLGRNLAWLDYNHDGLLDIYYGADRIPDFVFPPGTFPDTMIYRQVAGGSFVNANEEVGLTASSGTPLIADLNGTRDVDGNYSQELIFIRYGMLGEIFDTSSDQWVNVRRTWTSGITTPVFDDAVIADFDNDLRPDLYLTRSGVDDEVVLATPRQIRTYFTDVGPQKSFSFHTTGNLNVIFPRDDGNIQYERVHVGASGRNPFSGPTDFDFSLSTTNPDDHGLASLSQPGVYIGYDDDQQEWDYVVVTRFPSAPGFPGRGVIINSTAPISGLEAQGVVLNPPDAPDQLLLNNGSRFIDASVSSGISGMKVYGRNCAAGDFDNDGDVDIYVDQATPALNRQNLLLVNQGDGTFVRTVAPGAPSTGTGGAVAVADYNRDGFLDIVNLAGGSNPPYNALQDGAVQLYRNIPITDGRHNWLEVRLRGAQLDGDAQGANAEGIGAKVYVTTTGDGKTQFREAVAGQHIEAQDSPLLHFGLGGNTTISELRVLWPNGTASTVLNNVGINRIIEVTQPASAGQGPDQVGLLSPAESTRIDGDETGVALALPGGTDGAAPVLLGADPLLQLGLLQFESGAAVPTDWQGLTPDLSALEDDALPPADDVAIEAAEPGGAPVATGDWLVA